MSKRKLTTVLLACVISYPGLAQVQTFPTEAEVKEMEAKAQREIKSTLESIAAEALQTKTDASPEERRAQSAIVLRGNPDRQLLRTAFDKFVIWPRNTEAATWIIKYSEQALHLGISVGYESTAAIVEKLYRERARSGSASAPAIEWQEGLAELLVELGRYEEARDIVRNALAIRGESASPYLRVLAATIDRFNGDPEPLAGLLTECRAPDDAEQPADYCRQVARAIAARTVDLRLAKDSTGPVSLLLEVDQDYGTRLSDLRAIAITDKATAQRELLKIVRDKKAPAGARQDAAIHLSDIAKAQPDPRTAVAWRDCALRIQGVTIPSFPKDGWRQLVAYSKKPRVKQERCEDDEEEAECVAGTLANRLFSVMQRDEKLLARQSLEQAAAWTLAHQLQIFSLAQAFELFGEAELRKGLKEEGTRILEFALLLEPRLAEHDFDGVFKRNAISAAHETASPWDSPTDIGDILPRVCPD
jgi:hypothetical protein